MDGALNFEFAQEGCAQGAARRGQRQTGVRPPLPCPRVVDHTRDAALETIRRGRMVIQGPIMLAQGYQGLVFRVPIFLPGGPNETFG